MTSVLVAASSPVGRAGLKALVEDSPECVVAGSTHSAELVEHARELQPDAILWQLAGLEEASPTLEALAGQNTILLTGTPPLDLIRAGASGVLPPGATADQIGLALRATAAGLTVFVPDYAAQASAPPVTASDSAHLTARETEVLRMIAEGLANKEIAYRLGISEHTVKFHVSAVLGKLGAGSRAQAIGAGIRQGLILM